MSVRPDGETRPHPSRSFEELAVWQAVRLVDLDRDIGVKTQLDELLLPFARIRALGIAQCGERRHRAVSEDVDAVALDPLPHDLEHPLADATREDAVAEALAIPERRDLAFQERARVVKRDPHAVDVKLVQRTDHVME